VTLTPLVLAGVLLYGVPLARMLDARLRGSTLAGGAFLLGSGTIALHLFALSILRIEWTRTSVLLSLVPLFVFAVMRTRGLPWERPEGRPAWIDAITIVFVVSYAIFALWAPPYEWDFYGIWGLKGRWFYDAGGIDWTFVQTNISHPDYPLFVPLLYDFIAVVGGGWNDLAFGWLYVFLCASVIAVVRGMFADEVQSPALATLAMAFPSLNLWIGLAEGAVMAYGCAGLLFIRAGSYRIGAILLGFAAWSKNEGLALIGVAGLALLIATRSIRKALALWPAVAVIAPWLVARSVLKLPTDFVDGSVLERTLTRLGQLPDVARVFAASPPDQPWMWLAVFVTLIVFIRDAVRRERFLALAVTLQFGLMLAQALATPWDFGAHVSLTMNRLPHQIAPAAAFLAAMLLMRSLAGPSPSGESLPRPLPSTD
jgi:hypothetical protein